MYVSPKHFTKYLLCYPKSCWRSANCHHFFHAGYVSWCGSHLLLEQCHSLTLYTVLIYLSNKWCANNLEHNWPYISFTLTSFVVIEIKRIRVRACLLIRRDYWSYIFLTSLLQLLLIVLTAKWRHCVLLDLCSVFLRDKNSLIFVGMP